MRQSEANSALNVAAKGEQRELCQLQQDERRRNADDREALYQRRSRKADCDRPAEQDGPDLRSCALSTHLQTQLSYHCAVKYPLCCMLSTS